VQWVQQNQALHPTPCAPPNLMPFVGEVYYLRPSEMSVCWWPGHSLVFSPHARNSRSLLPLNWRRHPIHTSS